jgi:ABC-type spermidine/putrescine transport system permease subunit I
MKRPITGPLILSLVVTIFLSMIINNRVLHSAQQGADNVSIRYTQNARMNPDNAFWDMYPYSLGLATIVGIIVFIIAYLLTSKKKGT